MNVFQIKCFVTLAHASTFYEAAGKLYVSQSSFSNNIQTIERELGVNLVERGVRGFTLTDAGHAFLAYAEEIVGEHDRMNDLLEAYKSESESRILLYAEQLSSFGYNELLTQFRLHAPDIQMEISEFDGQDVSDILQTQDNAACIVFSYDDPHQEKTRKCTLLRDSLALLVNKGHPLAENPSVRLRDLRGQTPKLILPRRATFLFDYVMTQCQDAGITPDVSPHSLWYSTMIEVVRELNYIAAIPGKVAGIFCPPDMTILDVADARPYTIDLLIPENCKHEAVLRLLKFAEMTENPIYLL